MMVLIGQNCIAYEFSNGKVGTVLSLWNRICNQSESRYEKKNFEKYLQEKSEQSHKFKDFVA